MLGDKSAQSMESQIPLPQGSSEQRRIIPVMGTQQELGLDLRCLPSMPGVGAIVQAVVEYVQRLPRRC